MCLSVLRICRRPPGHPSNEKAPPLGRYEGRGRASGRSANRSPGHVGVGGGRVDALGHAAERVGAVAPVAAVGRADVLVRLEVVRPVAVQGERDIRGGRVVPMRLEGVAAVAVILLVAPSVRAAAVSLSVTATT